MIQFPPLSLSAGFPLPFTFLQKQGWLRITLLRYSPSIILIKIMRIDNVEISCTLPVFTHLILTITCRLEIYGTVLQRKKLGDKEAT